MIKAVFFDIDGTLVPWKSGRIPASVFESVAALRRKGILCFVATGRSPFEISAGHLIDGLDFDGYLLNNGELGVDADGTVFYRCPVDPDDLARLLDWVDKLCLRYNRFLCVRQIKHILRLIGNPSLGCKSITKTVSCFNTGIVNRWLS